MLLITNTEVHMSSRAHKFEDLVTGKTYLDQLPQFENVLREFLEELYVGGDFYDQDIESLDCRRRDGFIPHSHNHGGLERSWLTDLSGLWGSGSSCGSVEFDKRVETIIESSLKDARVEAARQGIIDENEINEFEYEFLNTPVYVGVRAMYEGKATNGVHTLMVYVGGNISEYHGPFGSGSTDFAEYEVRFRTVNGLRNQLKRLKVRIEKVL